MWSWGWNPGHHAFAKNLTNPAGSGWTPLPVTVTPPGPGWPGKGLVYPLKPLLLPGQTSSPGGWELEKEVQEGFTCFLTCQVL